MSLQVWLPLNGDLENKGLDNISYTGTSTYEASKKLPQGINVKTSSFTITSPALNGAKNFSAAFWVMCKSDSTITRDWNQCLQLGTRTVTGASSAAFRFESTNTYDPRAISTHNNETYSITRGSRVLARNKDQWYHICVTYDGAHVYYYSNGAYIGTDAGLGGCLNGKIIIGHSSYPGTINDLRVYDHVLSQKEINELYKTKVLHYDLASDYKYDNLLKNSRTFSSTNWTGNGVRNENAFLDTFYSMSYININGDTTTYKDIAQQPGIIGKLGATYTLTCWVKGSGQFIAYFYGPSGYIQCAKAETSQGTTFTSGDGHAKINLSNVWQKIWIKWTLKTTGDESITKNLLYRLYGGNNLEIAMPKLILGDDENTPWLPNSTDNEYITLGYNSTSVYDQSGMGYDGINIDVTNNGYFNGTTSTINKIPNPLKTADEFTIATWVQFDAVESYALCTARTGVGIGLAVFYTGGKIRFDDGNLQTTFNQTIPANTRMHLAVTRNNSNKSLYINGELIQTVNQVGDLSAMGDYMSIGAASNTTDGVGSGYFTKGYYSDFRIYATALTSENIKQLYSTGTQIDDNGNTYTKLLIEDDNASLSVSKEIVTKAVSERLKTYDMKIDFLEDGSEWARIFYHNNKAKTVLFKSVDECRNTQTEDKYSRLYLIDDFRGSDGKFEFMLKYPNNSTGYNRWKQSNNPCNEYWPHTADVYETVEGYEPISISWTASNWGGLCRQNESTTSYSPCYLSGSVGHNNWFYSIGAASTHNDGIPTWNGSTDSVVELWIRIDNALIKRKNICPTKSSYWESGHYTVETGEKGNQGARIRLIDLLPVESGLAYYFNTFSDSHQFVLREMNVNKVLVKSLGAIGNGSSVTLQPTTRYLAVTVIDHIQWDNTTSENIINSMNDLTLKPFICLSSETDKTYEEYNEDTQTILTTAKFGSKFININKINEI